MLLRSFLAFVLPDELLEYIVGIQEQLRRHYSGFRWVARENLHLTVHFLGNKTAEQLEEIAVLCSLALADFKAVQVLPGKTGAFPDRHNARVLWLSLLGDLDELRRIHRQTGAALRGIGCQIDGRPFVPHITLARRRETDRQGGEVAEYVPAGNRSFMLNEINLYTSRLTPAGPMYSIYRNFLLKNNRN